MAQQVVLNSLVWLSSITCNINCLVPLGSKVNTVLNLDDNLAAAKAEAETTRKQLMDSARDLSETRLAVLPLIETEIGSLLNELGMPNASLHIKAETSLDTIAQNIRQLLPAGRAA